MDKITIVFDVETTGLDPYKDKHRIIEIGAIKLVNGIRDSVFHYYIDPEREIDLKAYQVHGINSEFLKGKCKFADIVDELLTFFQGATLVAHNAKFDMGFINYELSLLKLKPLEAKVIDTLEIARRKFPGARARLEDLCNHYKIDMSSRTLHGALIDTELLVKVYIELMGGAQSSFKIYDKVQQGEYIKQLNLTKTKVNLKTTKLIEPTVDENKNHAEFVKTINNSLWNI